MQWYYRSLTKLCRQVLERIVFHGYKWPPRMVGPTLANRLIVSEADMSATVEDQVTAFHWACGLGHIDATRLMIAHGANINLPDMPDITQHSIAPASVRIPLSLAQGVALIGYGLATLVRTFKQDHARHPGI